MDVTIPCPCPPKADGAARHETDTVTLADVLDFRRTLTVRQEVRFAVEAASESGRPLSVAEMTAVMVEAYLIHGIAGWSLVDDKGKPLAPTRGNVAAFIAEHYEEAEAVGNAADDLYTDKVLLPLLNRESVSSVTTPTPGSTSAKNGHSTKAPKPSKRSLTTTTPMDATGPMAASPGGVSNSSLS